MLFVPPPVVNTTNDDGTASTGATADATSSVAIVFPGAGGIDSLTEELTTRLSNNNGQENKNDGSSICWATTIDWKAYRGSIVTAAFDAEAVGQAVASRLWLLLPEQQQQFKAIHIIGISVGAFAANSMAKYLYESSGRESSTATRRRKTPHIRLTLLDPFCSRGLWGINYGHRYFGIHADYAEQYLNTDDDVPFTNKPLSHCYCIDVTGAPERNAFVLPKGERSMHCWPVAYYARHGYQPTVIVDNDNGTTVYPQHDDSHSRGMVTKL